MKLRIIDKIGSINGLLAAAPCPACFPLLAAAGAALGLGILRPYEGVVLLLFQVFVLVSLLGNAFAWRSHRKIVPLIVGLASLLLVLFVLHFYINSSPLYTGLASIVLVSGTNYHSGWRCASCIRKEAQ